jgi:hypothetical protein
MPPAGQQIPELLLEIGAKNWRMRAADKECYKMTEF